jgi:deoxyuridine 5'-triphosphate nucleotidohydrolase
MQHLRLKVLDETLYTDELARGFKPRRQGDAGIDLRAVSDTLLPRFATVKIGLGIAIEIPQHTVGWVTGRSSTSTALGIITHEGKIDAGYRGQIHAIVTALDGDVQITRGERIAQLVVVQIVTPNDAFHRWDVVEALSKSERGTLGLGSSGRV